MFLKQNEFDFMQEWFLNLFEAIHRILFDGIQ